MSDLTKTLIRLGTTNPELRPHIRPVLASLGKASGSKLTISFKHGLSVRFVEGSNPSFGEIGSAAYLNESKSGVRVVRAAIQFARDNLAKLQSMGPYNEVVEAINEAVSDQIGKFPKWDYTQFPD